jgi:hypothetical protein
MWAASGQRQNIFNNMGRLPRPQVQHFVWKRWKLIAPLPLTSYFIVILHAQFPYRLVIGAIPKSSIAHLCSYTLRPALSPQAHHQDQNQRMKESTVLLGALCLWPVFLFLMIRVQPIFNNLHFEIILYSSVPSFPEGSTNGLWLGGHFIRHKLLWIRFWIFLGVLFP